MSNLRRRIIFGFLLLLVIGVFSPLCHQPAFAAWNLSDVRAGDFAPGQLEAHYLKHGDQFGHITKEQYLQDAQALLDAAAQGDVLEKIRSNGDIEHFRVSTGEFAVMTRRGRIRTYYKIDYGHWLTRG